MVYHCFSDVGIWASLGKHENLNDWFKKKFEIVMRAEHEIGTKLPKLAQNRDVC